MTTTLITGANTGLGKETARLLLTAGHTVYVGARDEGRGRAAAEEVGARFVQLDVTDDTSVASAFAQIEADGGLDVLVNNVGGVHLRLNGFLSTTDADFQASLELNFFSALRATRAAVAAMIEQGGGTIVNVASVNAFFQPDGAVIDYGAAKAALLNVAKALSQELGPHGIRIASVSPGQVETDLWLGADGVAATIGAATGAGADAVRAQAMAGIPTGRFTTPREVATLVALLASPRTANVTGANYVIDGGLVKTM